MTKSNPSFLTLLGGLVYTSRTHHNVCRRADGHFFFLRQLIQELAGWPVQINWQDQSGDIPPRWPFE